MPKWRGILQDPKGKEWMEVLTQDCPEDEGRALMERQNRLLSELHEREPYVLTVFETID